MSLLQNCICFEYNISDELIYQIINNLNNSNLDNSNNKIYPLESIMIFGIIFLMIIVFFAISKCLKKNTINPYSKNQEQEQEQNNLNNSQES